MDPLFLVMMAVLALFIFFQFRSSKKRRADQENLNSKMVPGAEVMTQFGVFGTLLSIDDEKNEALLETTPGTVLRLHRQTILKVVEDDVVDDETVEDVVADETQAGDPDVVVDGPDGRSEPGSRPSGKSDDTQ